MNNKEMILRGRTYAQSTLHVLIEDITQIEASNKDHAALMLFTVQQMLTDALLMLAKDDRAHALKGIGMIVRQVEININKYYDARDEEKETRQ